MKLAAKLMISPLLAAGVAMGAGAFSTMLQYQDSKAAQQRFNENVRILTSSSQATEKLAGLHASAYRTQAIADSIGEAGLKEFRNQLSLDIKELQETFDTFSSSSSGSDKDLSVNRPDFRGGCLV